MNKRLMEFGVFLVMLFLMIFALVIYIVNYDKLDDNFDKINQFNIILGSLLIFNLVVYFSKALERVYKRNKIGKIIYKLKPEVNFFFPPALFLLISSGIVLAIWLNLYITIRPSFVGLTMIILFSVMTFDSLAVLLSETGIAEKGLVDGNNFYLWDEVLSYKYDESNNKLILSVKKKYLFFRIKGKSKLCYNEAEKSQIDQLLMLNKN